jgi:hypothetical protein
MVGRQGWNLKSENRTFDPVSSEAHYAWKGRQVKPASGRQRARYRYKKLGKCEVCQKSPAIERHHKDADTTNNDRSNIQFVCRRCHMALDGRLAVFAENQKLLAVSSAKPAKPCDNCGRPAKPRRKGRCYACDMFFRRHQREWTEADAGTKPRMSKAILSGEINHSDVNF